MGFFSQLSLYLFIGATSLRDYIRHLRELGLHNAERDDAGRERHGARAVRRLAGPNNRVPAADGNIDELAEAQGIGAGELLRRNAENVAARLERLEAQVEQMLDGLDDTYITYLYQWMRHLDDGSVNFIEGAKQPSYLVTADDVDTLLAIQVQPLDDRKRKGEIVKVYANEQRKITCDPETKELIEKTLEIGHASYEVQLPQVRFLNMWEPAVLAIKREGYSIKCNGKRGVVLTEKFQPATAINVPYGRPTEFSIMSADGVEFNLKPAENTPQRDTIILVLRLFRIMAVEKRRGRKKILEEK